MKQVDVEIADACARILDSVLEARPPGEIDDDSRQRLVQRHVCMPIACDAAFIAERIGESLAQHDADILYRVMCVDGEIAAGAHLDIEKPVTRDLIEHVLEEGHTGIEAALAGAVEIERNRDLRFPCITSDRRLTCRHSVPRVSTEKGV